MAWLRELWTQIWITLVVAAVSLALYTSLGRQLIPLVETYRVDLEQQLSDLSGQPVSIGQLEGDWNKLSPVVRLYDVQFGPVADGLHINSMEAELDVSASLFYRLPVFRRVQIGGVAADVYQQSDTQWRIGSQWVLDLSVAPRQPSAAGSDEIDSDGRPLWLHWLELQQTIIFSDWQLIAFDPAQTREELNIDRLTWRNQGNSHELDGNIAWGRDQLANIRLMASLEGELWPWADQDGEVYLDIDDQEWKRWIPASLPAGLDVKSFHASARAWLSIRDGDLNELYLDADVPALTVATRAETLTLTDGHIRAAGKHSGDDWHLQVRPQFKESLPFSQLSLSSVALTDKKGWQFGIPALDITAAREFLQRHKLLPEPFRRYLENTAGQGNADNVRISLIPGSPWQIDVRAELKEVSSTAYHGIPALSGVSGQLHLKPDAGVLQVEKDDLSVFLSDIYAQPWQLKNARGRFYWAIHPDYAQLQLQGFQAELLASSADADADADAGMQSWPFAADLALAIPRKDGHKEASIDLLVGMPNASASLRRQLVPAILDDGIRHWIDQSITAGQFDSGAFILHRVLTSEAPQQSQTAQLYLGFRDASVHYLEDWPEAEELAGHLLLKAPELDVWIDEGRTLGGQLTGHQGRVSIAANKQGQTELTVTAHLRGDSQEGLRYLTATPLAEVVNHAFDDWQVSGPLDSRFRLRMPLGSSDAQPDIQLDANIDDTRLLLPSLKLDFTNLQGQIRYRSDSGLTSDHLEGDTFGGHFLASITSEKHSGGFDILLNADGDAQWQPFHQWLPTFLLDPVTGQLDYHAALTVTADGLHFTLESPLQGTEIALPFPYGKTASESRLLAVEVRPGDESRINLSYDQRVRAALAMDQKGISRGQVYLGDTEPFLSGDSGINIKGHIPETLSAADWWATWQSLMAAAEAEDAAIKKASAKKTLSKPAAASSGLVRSVDVSLGDIDVWGVAAGPVQVHATQQWNEWNFQVDSTLMKGQVTLKADDSPIQLNFDYVHMPVNDSVASSTVGPVAEDSTALTAADPLADLRPADFPAVDLTLAELYVGTRNFGRWNIQSRPLAAGAGAAFKILDSDTKGMKVQGDVRWQYQKNAGHSTHLDTLQITSDDIGRVQRAFRQDAVIEGKDMSAMLQLSWKGSPLAYNNQSLNGLGSLRIRNGSMEAEGTGALKAFGALNFNSVARRLRLDFSDLYQDGVSFDIFKGKARVENGVMTLTEPMTMDGPGGKFLTSGSTNLMTETLDMKMVVTFPVSSTLPMVALLAGLAPPVAASIYVTEKLIGDELARFTSASYDLKGTWQAPELKINKAFDNKMEGQQERSLWQRIISIFNIFGDDE